MDKKAKIWIGLVIFAVAAVLVWAFSAEQPVAEKPQAQPQPPLLSYTGNTIVEEKDGKKIWELTAATIEMNPKTNDTVLKEVIGRFYQADGGIIELTAPEGIYDTKHQTIKFLQGVTAEATDGSSFEADSASWNTAQELLHAEGSVKVVKEDAVLTGDILDSDAAFENVKVSGNARIVKGG